MIVQVQIRTPFFLLLPDLEYCSKGIILSMQINLLKHIITPNLRLQSRNCIRHADSHRRGSTHKDSSTSTQHAPTVRTASGPFLEHVPQIRPAILDAPPAIDLMRYGEGKSHERFLEFGGGLGESKVEAGWWAEGACWSGALLAAYVCAEVG